MKSTRKPPLPRSPISLRPRRGVRPPPSSSVPPPRASSRRTAVKAVEKESKADDPMKIKPEYKSITCELEELEEMVRQQLGSSRYSSALTAGGGRGRTKPPFLERGRFYEEYSARRDERMKKRKIEETATVVVDCSKIYRLEETLASSPAATIPKKFESLEKSKVVETQQKSRYSLRSSSRINKKTPLQPLAMNNINGSAVAATADRKIRKIRKL